MTEKLHLQGRWWLPEHEDHHVFGILSWDADEGGTLRLHDELRPIVWLDNVRADGSVQKYRAGRGESERTYPLIFGRVDNRAYTLLNSFRTGVREFDLDERSEQVHVNRFIEGAWFDDPDQLSVDRVTFDMRHLTTWIDRSGLEVEFSGPDETRGDVFAVVTAKSLSSLSGDLNDRTFRLMQRLETAGDRVHQAGIAQSWRFGGSPWFVVKGRSAS